MASSDLPVSASATDRFCEDVALLTPAPPAPPSVAAEAAAEAAAVATPTVCLSLTKIPAGYRTGGGLSFAKVPLPAAADCKFENSCQHTILSTPRLGWDDPQRGECSGRTACNSTPQGMPPGFKINEPYRKPAETGGADLGRVLHITDTSLSAADLAEAVKTWFAINGNGPLVFLEVTGYSRKNSVANDCFGNPFCAGNYEAAAGNPGCTTLPIPDKEKFRYAIDLSPYYKHKQGSAAAALALPDDFTSLAEKYVAKGGCCSCDRYMRRLKVDVVANKTEVLQMHVKEHLKKLLMAAGENVDDFFSDTLVVAEIHVIPGEVIISPAPSPFCNCMCECVKTSMCAPLFVLSFLVGCAIGCANNCCGCMKGSDPDPFDPCSMCPACFCGKTSQYYTTTSLHATCSEKELFEAVKPHLSIITMM